MAIGYQPAQRDCVTVGGRVLTEVKNLIQLSGFAAAGKYSVIRKPNTASGYQVPAGKTFRAVAVRMGASATCNIFAGYGDTDVGLDSVAASTNTVWPLSLSNAVAYIFTAGTQELATDFTVPTGKYVEVSPTASAYFTIFGYEE